MREEALSAIRRKMDAAAVRAGRRPEEVTLVAVTKTVGVAMVREAFRAGLRIFGENRVQEAREKAGQLPEEEYPGIRWHLIGHLQKNKVKQAVQLFDLIHSVDSPGLAEELHRQAERTGKMQRVLVQVKLSPEETKHGAAEQDLLPLLGRVRQLGALKVEGLMTMPPFFDDPEKARPYFRKLRELRDRAEKEGFRLPELSMGMSDDFEVAIEEGATLVRIGTALFGERSG
ncbi:MAG: YggS family pyridoxal phosphate-dependent enzyme [Alphaproteobacteria bacterium]|uniref:Pyridoxal phosphate homeostasis protein n=1 Tax=Candidatus Nitrobium versatile TaxID=2884831 RepID=A0A953J7B2_9BACT|nr:YggS family pyridoxal phosphate-dependent enzyme [Candidatus Nitrobium versatile]